MRRSFCLLFEALMNAYVDLPDFLRRREQGSFLLRRHQGQVSNLLRRVCANGCQQRFKVFQPPLHRSRLQDRRTMNTFNKCTVRRFQEMEFGIQGCKALGSGQYLGFQALKLEWRDYLLKVERDGQQRVSRSEEHTSEL